MAVGAGATVYVMRRVSKAAESYGPAGLSRRASELSDAVRYFADEVRAGMADRESELREALGIADDSGDVGIYDPVASAATRPDEPRRAP
jgi:hypothetical protein